MTLTELKAKYQKIVAECREAEKTADVTTSRIEANDKLQTESNNYMSADRQLGDS